MLHRQKLTKETIENLIITAIENKKIEDKQDQKRREYLEIISLNTEGLSSSYYAIDKGIVAGFLEGIRLINFSVSSDISNYIYDTEAKHTKGEIKKVAKQIYIDCS